MGIEGVGSVGYSNGVAGVASQPQPQQQQASEAPEVASTQAAVPEVTQPQANSQLQTGSEAEEDKKKGKDPTDDQIKKAVNEINKKAVDSEAVFGIHEKTNRVTIKIVDKKTKDVIKEVPAEKTLDLIAKAWELAGLLVDEKR